MTLNDLKKSPPLLIAICVIAAATFLIIYMNPMHSVCDIQVAALRQGMEGYMYPKNIGDKYKPAIFADARKSCREGNSSGACDDYFSVQRQLIRELNKVNAECIPAVAEQNAYRDVLGGALVILAAAAWGDKLPESSEERLGWLTEGELALFCDVKKNYLKFYGKEALTQVENRTFKDLPGDSLFENSPTSDPNKLKLVPVVETLKKMGIADLRGEVFKRSLFSLDCRFY